MTIDERINAIEDWIGGNVGHRPNGEGQWETHYDAMNLTRLLRKHLTEVEEDTAMHWHSSIHCKNLDHMLCEWRTCQCTCHREEP